MGGILKKLKFTYDNGYSQTAANPYESAIMETWELNLAKDEYITRIELNADGISGIEKINFFTNKGNKSGTPCCTIPILKKYTCEIPTNQVMVSTGAYIVSMGWTALVPYLIDLAKFPQDMIDEYWSRDSV